MCAQFTMTEPILKYRRDVPAECDPRRTVTLMYPTKAACFRPGPSAWPGACPVAPWSQVDEIACHSQAQSVFSLCGQLINPRVNIIVVDKFHVHYCS